MKLSRRGLFRALIGAPVAAQLPTVIPIVRKPLPSCAAMSKTLAELNAFTAKYLTARMPETIFRESPLFVRLKGK